MNNYNDFDDNDYEVDDLNSLDDDFNNESDSILDKVKSKFNKLNTNIKSKFNKNESNFNNQPNQQNNYGDSNYGDDNLENIGNVAFYRKKPFIFGSIGLVSIALLATAIAVPLSLQQTSSSNEDVSGIKPSNPLDFATKLQIVNQLPNTEKTKIWNQYVNQSSVLLNWSNTAHQGKILDFLAANYEAANTSQIFKFTPQGGTKVDKSVVEMFKEILNILRTKNTYYYDPGSLAYEKVLLTFPENESFLSLNSQSAGSLAMRYGEPAVSISSYWKGIPDTPNIIGVSKQNIEFNFTLDKMSIKFPYNETYLKSNAYNANDQPSFLYFLTDNWVRDTAYYLKPINNTLTIDNSNTLFSGFSLWMKDHLTNNYN